MLFSNFLTKYEDSWTGGYHTHLSTRGRVVVAQVTTQNGGPLSVGPVFRGLSLKLCVSVVGLSV